MNPFLNLFERQKRTLRDGRDAELRVANRTTRPHGQARRGERVGTPAGGRAGLQDGQPGAGLRDARMPRRGRVPEEPAQGLDGADRGARAAGLAATGHRGIVYRDPYGVALIIGPFNGPLLLLLRPAITALAAGNCCVLKLSEKLYSTSALLLDLVPKYFEPDAVAAVTGHREEITELLKLPFDFIFFTGSTSTGKVIARAAAENLTPVLLELGGQNPALVDETANIPDAAKKIVWGTMAWGGQWCTSPGYAYVHESVAEAFVGKRRRPLSPFTVRSQGQSRLFARHRRTRSLATRCPDRSGEGGHRRPVRPGGPLP